MTPRPPRRSLLGVALLLLILAFSHPHQALCQPGVDKVDLDQKEKIAVRRAVDQIVVKLRHYYATGEYDKVIEECDNLAKIDPKNAIGSYYRSLAMKRKEEQATVREIGPTAGIETPPPATQAPPEQTPVPTATPSPTVSFTSRITDLAQTAAPFAIYGLIAIAAVGVLGGIIIVGRKTVTRKPRAVVEFTEPPAPPAHALPGEPASTAEPAARTSLSSDVFPFEEPRPENSLDMSLHTETAPDEESVAVIPGDTGETRAGEKIDEEPIVPPTEQPEAVGVADGFTVEKFLGLGSGTQAPATGSSLDTLNSLDHLSLDVGEGKKREPSPAPADVGFSISEPGAELARLGLSTEPLARLENEELLPSSTGELKPSSELLEEPPAEESVVRPASAVLDDELFGEKPAQQKEEPLPPIEDIKKLKKTAYDEDFEKLMFAGESQDETIVAKSVMEDETLVAPLAPGKSDKGKIIRLDTESEREDSLPSAFDSRETVILGPEEIEPAPGGAGQSAGKAQASSETVIESQEAQLPETPSAAPGTQRESKIPLAGEIGFKGLEELLEETSEKDELPSIAGAAETFGKTGTIEERNEALFRDQYKKGCKAYEEGDWKKAVHFFTVAAALKPDVQEVRERLRIAKAERKRLDPPASPAGGS